MIKKQYWVIFLLFASFFSFSQKFSFKVQPLVFKKSQTNEIIIIDNDETIIKLNKNVKIPLKHNGFLGKLKDYIPFNIKDKTYLVHSGCGPVLEFRNDSLVRIDNSFLHSNQHGAVTFTYNNEIYFFGGYGLFSTKKFITKFDFETKEWRLVKTKNNHLIEPLASSFFYKGKEYLYVFGGQNQTLDDERLKNTEFVYRLHFKNMTWERLRTDFFTQDKKRTVNTENGTRFFEFNNELVLLDKQKLYKINFDKNTCTEYNSNFDIKSVLLIPNKNKIIVLIEDLSHNTKFNFLVEQFSLKDILKTPINEYPFYYEEQPYYLYGLGSFVFLGLVFVMYKKRSFITYYLHPNFPFQYWKQTEILYFKGKEVKHLSDDDIKILNKIASHPNQFISLNEFNELFSIDYDSENYSAIVKRREKKLDIFLQLLANVSSYDLKDILYERKNEVDKRIKEVLFLPLKIKFLDK